MEREKEQLYQIALLQVKSIGPAIFRKLLSHFKTAENIFNASKLDFLNIDNFSKDLYNKIKTSTDIIRIAENELNYCSKNNVKITLYSDKEYPFQLKNCNDAPQILYQKGNGRLNTKRVISVVGTRNCSHYGIDFCKILCKELSSYKTVIVSGLAYGIDYNAHKYAIKNQLSTFAVLGHGIKHIYPVNHSFISNEIQNKGLLISEFLSETKPSKYTFPKRNRIIAGISDATIIIESPIKGGSMITARIANSYNKDVFALPGSVFSRTSIGCNFLIKNNEAHLIDSITEFIKMMSWEETINTKNPLKPKAELSNEEFKIIKLIQKSDNISIDDLCKDLKVSVGILNSRLTMLELKGIVQQLPGKIFRIIV